MHYCIAICLNYNILMNPLPSPAASQKELLISQKEALKYLKSGISNSLSYELFTLIPLKSLPTQPASLILKYTLLRLTSAIAL